jgi:MFS family permease
MGKKTRKKLPREFWAVNASNLFERGAYYGMLAVFSYHLIYNVGIESWMVGILTGISMGMINFLPLISTALASKYGFKKLLLFSYTTLCIGYIVLGFGYTLVLIFLAVIIMSTGSGFEKALIAASISHSSDEQNRVYAFNIYYWIINIGAFLIPLSLTFLFVPAEYGSVFFLMALFIVCSFLIIFLSYKNPIEPDPSIPTLKAVKNLKVIFKDPKFAYVLIIFAGCWFMLYTRKPFMPVFMTDFKILPAWFIPVLAALNPGTIITLGQIWAYIIKDRSIDSLKMLITGVIIVSLGFLIAGFSMNPILFIVGIIILSFGELVSYPAFLSYVSKIPPKDKRSIYMGYSFIPLAIAGVAAPIIGGFLYYIIVENMAMGRLFWAIIASIGLISASAFILYDRHYNKKKKIKIKGFFKVFKRHPFISKVFANIPILMIPVILIIGFSFGPDPIYRGPLSEEDLEDDSIEDIIWTSLNKSFSFKGELDEAESVSYDLSLSNKSYIDQITLNLNWADEPDTRRLRKFENTGDTFNAKIIIDEKVVDEFSSTNNHEQSGKINLRYDSSGFTNKVGCNVNVKIELVKCGNFYPYFGFKHISIEDSSNTFELEIDVTYMISNIPE